MEKEINNELRKASIYESDGDFGLAEDCYLECLEILNNNKEIDTEEYITKAKELYKIIMLFYLRIGDIDTSNIYKEMLLKSSSYND